MRRCGVRADVMSLTSCVVAAKQKVFHSVVAAGAGGEGKGGCDTGETTRGLVAQDYSVREVSFEKAVSKSWMRSLTDDTRVLAF